MSSDPKNYFGFLVDEMSERGHISTLLTATLRVHFAFTEGRDRLKRDRITIQRNSARQHKAMTSLYTSSLKNAKVRASQHHALCWFFNFVKVYCSYSSMLLIYLRKRSLSFVLK